MGFNDLIRNNERVIEEISFDPIEKLKEFIYEDEYFQQLILHSIYSRVKNKGEDIRGIKLRTDKAIQANENSGGNRFYSPRNKTKSRQRHVDLYMSGYMFNTMQVILKKKSIVVGVDLITNKSSSVYQNFTVMYSSQQQFKDLIFSLNQREINDLNDKLSERMNKYLKEVFNYR